MTDPSNADFNKVLTQWNTIAKRMWIWNYVVDFGDLLEAFPNYYVMGPNIKYTPASLLLRLCGTALYPAHFKANTVTHVGARARYTLKQIQ